MTTSYNSTLPKANTFLHYILLADDDEDDCLLFKEALAEVQASAKFTYVNNGEKLMQLLNNSGLLPGYIFLDMNMPRKNGLQCLIEIKEIECLRAVPVIVLSTSLSET